jgi:hypothetical protein
MDLVSDIGDNREIGGGYVGALPASFAAHLAHSTGESRHSKEQKQEQELFTKIMMSRMNSLEEGFREVIHEMRGHMRQDEQKSPSRGRAARGVPKEKRPADREKDRSMTAEPDKENIQPEAEHNGQEGSVVETAQKVGDIDTDGSSMEGGAESPARGTASSH